jgi:hypothetical protein
MWEPTSTTAALREFTNTFRQFYAAALEALPALSSKPASLVERRRQRFIAEPSASNIFGHHRSKEHPASSRCSRWQL